MSAARLRGDVLCRTRTRWWLFAVASALVVAATLFKETGKWTRAGALAAAQARRLLVQG